MTSKSSKAIPFIIIAIASIFIAVDTFTEYEVTQEMVNLASIILAPIGVGGLVNKGWNVYKSIKVKT